MFKIEQNHGLKYLIERFERTKLRFQYEKRNEIRDALHNIYEIDSIYKELRKEDFKTLELLHKEDPTHVDHFLSAASELIRKIIKLMKAEESELIKLHNDFLHHADIGHEKHEILSEERSEESYAKRLEAWAQKMSVTVEKVNARVNKIELSIFQKRLKDLSKDMQWFEDEVEEEIKAIEANEDITL